MSPPLMITPAVKGEPKGRFEAIQAIDFIRVINSIYQEISVSDLISPYMEVCNETGIDR